MEASFVGKNIVVTGAGQGKREHISYNTLYCLPY